MARVIEEGVSDIPVSEMKDGEVGVITQWSTAHHMIGIIIQRVDNQLISIGKHSDDTVIVEAVEENNVISQPKVIN